MKTKRLNRAGGWLGLLLVLRGFGSIARESWGPGRVGMITDWYSILSVEGWAYLSIAIGTIAVGTHWRGTRRRRQLSCVLVAGLYASFTTSFAIVVSPWTEVSGIYGSLTLWACYTALWGCE